MDQKEVILCEALIDAMTFWCVGYRNVTASYGTQGFTDDHLALFKRCGIERVLIAYDRDQAGNTAAEKLAKQLQQSGFGCYRIELPKGMDVNEYAWQVTPAAVSLGLVIRKASWLGEGQAPERQSDIDPLPEPPAEVEPTAPVGVDAETLDKEIHLTFGDRKYGCAGWRRTKTTKC